MRRASNSEEEVLSSYPSRHLPHIVPLIPQSSAQEVCPSAGLHADQALTKVRCETKQLKTRTLFTNHNFACALTATR